MSHLVVGCSPVFSCGGVWNHRFSTEANFLTLPVHSPAWCRRSRKACFALRWSPTEPEANCKSDDTLAPGSNWVLHVWWCLIQMQFFRFNMTCTLFYISFSKYTTDFMKSYEKKGMETGTWQSSGFARPLQTCDLPGFDGFGWKP